MVQCFSWCFSSLCWLIENLSILSTWKTSRTTVLCLVVLAKYLKQHLCVRGKVVIKMKTKKNVYFWSGFKGPCLWFQGLWGETCWAPTLCRCQVELLTLTARPESERRGASIFLHHPMPRTGTFWISLESCLCLQARVCNTKFMESRAGLELVHLRHCSFAATHCTCTTVSSV